MFGILTVYQTMVEQAATLEGLTQREVRKFKDILFNPMFIDGYKPTKAEERLYQRITTRLFDCPRTKLEVSKAERDFLKRLVQPQHNAQLYGLPSHFIPEIKPTDYDPKTDPRGPSRFMCISEIEPDQPLLVTIDSSVGKIISGPEVFLLYAKFKDHNDPERVKQLINHGYPLEKIPAPEKQQAVDLPLHPQFVPAYLLIGNKVPAACNEALAYVNSRYCRLPDSEAFHQSLEHNAGFFAAMHLIKPVDLENARKVQDLETEIARLEQLRERKG